MVSDARDRMIETAIVLLAQRGYQATSFTDVLAESKAPRGSIYHHFPRGKDQLIADAIAVQGDKAIEILGALEGESAEDVAGGFLAMWRAVLEALDFTTGCSVVAVTVSSGDDDLVAKAGDVFRAWRARLAELLHSGGMSHADAAGFAALLLAAAEGAVVVARAERDLAAFELVAEQLLDRARTHVEPRPSGPGLDDLTQG